MKYETPDVCRAPRRESLTASAETAKVLSAGLPGMYQPSEETVSLHEKLAPVREVYARWWDAREKSKP